MAIQAPGAPSAVITGASTGIGRATALHLDERGFRVFAGVRRQQDGEALRESASERLSYVILDVESAASLEVAAKTVESAVGEAGLQGIVNNAGISVPAVFEFMDLDELRRQLEVNVVGAVAATKAFLPAIRRAKGRIVNIGSMGGYNAGPFMSPYAASKFALEALTDSLRRELRPWGMQVSIVEPGSIATPIWDKGLGYAAELKERLPERGRELYGDAFDAMENYARSASKRGIAPEAVARAVHHALTASRPRTRYRVGLDARLMRVLTRILPDRTMDAIVSRLIGF